MYQYLDAALVRAPALDHRSLKIPWPDLTTPGAAPPSWREWLDQAWRAPMLADAIETASPDLAHQVTRILSDDDLPEASVRRVVVSVLRYLLRGTTRATPFGLLAGVAPARIAAAATFRIGTGHQAIARPDEAWLADVTDTLETDDVLFPALSVVASELATTRNGHFVITHQPSRSGGNAPERVRIRSTPPVRAALDASRVPVEVSTLATTLAANFPDVADSVINGLIAQLIRLGFLVTSLRAPMTSSRPLAGLLAGLESAAVPIDARAQRLWEVSTCLDRHNSAVDPATARRERHRADAIMASIHPSSGTALAVDLRLGWDLAIPEPAAAEAARAADALARLARRPSLSSAWTTWHSRFLDRYGPKAAVPVLDVTDDSIGLGFPAGFLGSPEARQQSPLTERDKMLLKIAQEAVMNGDQEISLDDELIEQLSPLDPADPVQPSAEMTLRVHSPSVRDLNNGLFTLHVIAASRAAGTVAGRFLYMLDPSARDRTIDACAALPGLYRNSLLAQISAAPLYARSGNIARSLQAAGTLISLGEHRPEHGPERIPVSDLAVTADACSLHLLSVSRGQPVHTILPSAVDLSVHTHPLARFILEASVALAAPCTSFDWGAAYALPFVPAVRYGKTILSPARWVLEASCLSSPDAGFPQWDDTFNDWANTVRLPRHVYVGDGDRCIALDLEEASHRVLLRAEVSRSGQARLRTAVNPGDLGWTDGRPHEIVIPLVQSGSSREAVRAHSEVVSPGHGYPPGGDGRLYLKLYGPGDLQDIILTRHLPELAVQTGSQGSIWFLRYDDPRPHLRVRLSPGNVSFGPAAEQASRWTGELRESGLITEVTWETYYPESARFGGTTAMTFAESFFAADSAAAAAQLAASISTGGPDTRALTAASMTDIIVGMTGDHADAMRWLAAQPKPASGSPPRDVYNEAVALVRDLTTGPGNTEPAIRETWSARRTSLAAYRAALEQAGTISPLDLLPDLLHLHHARVSGPDLEAERVCLHLARSAALSWLARTRKKAS